MKTGTEESIGDESVIYLSRSSRRVFSQYRHSKRGAAEQVCRPAEELVEWMNGNTDGMIVRHGRRGTRDSGICIPVENAGQLERTSLDLTVSQPYRSILQSISAKYFEDEITLLVTSTLEQELVVLNGWQSRRNNGRNRKLKTIRYDKL